MSQVVFKINGKTFKVDGKFGPDYTLNEYVRVQMDLRGTKTMCFEGGCGICIVSIKAKLPPTNEMKIFAVNSCLVSVLSCHGWEVTTIKGIGNQKKGYHEIQKQLARFHGSQCGFCSPGFVLNMYSLYEARNKHVSSVEVENSFGSNLCRCTGYRPILDAFKSLAYDADQKFLNEIVDVEDLANVKSCNSCSKECLHQNTEDMKAIKIREDENEFDGTWCVIEKDENKMFHVDCDKCKWYKVFTIEDIFTAMQNGDYKLIAGNTGQGVYHVSELPPHLIDISTVAELKGYVVDVNLILGAGMTLTELAEVFRKLSTENDDFSYLRELDQHLDLVAHLPVRNIGTIAGNLFLQYTYNEFQSDLFVMFSTVGAMVTIAESIYKKQILTLDAFLKYNMANKMITNVILPPLSKCCSIKTYKVMPRAQNSHAIVNAGFLLKFPQNSHLLESANIVYGGIAPKFTHAIQTEAILAGEDPFTDSTLQKALKCLLQELKPTENLPEPSADYRRMLAVSLFYKAILHLCPDDKVNVKYKSGGDMFKRITSKGVQVFDSDQSVWPLNQPVQKVDALVQCAGEALFSNDINTYVNDLFATFVTADAVPGSIISDFDSTEALKLPGVIAFYTFKDIPGQNNFTPKLGGILTDAEEILCSGTVKFYGQPAGIVVTKRQNIAVIAAKLVKITYSSINMKKPLLTIQDVLKSTTRNQRVKNNKIVEPKSIGKDVKYVINGEFNLKGQYHFHLEPQTSTVLLTEDGLEVHSAAQWIDLVHIAVSECLKMPLAKPGWMRVDRPSWRALMETLSSSERVTTDDEYVIVIKVIVSRVGGGYGGKISRASQIACAASLVTFLSRKTCRFILPMETNMTSIGKRLPTDSKFEVGVNNEGVIQYLKNTFYQDCGHSFNESIAHMTVGHFTNCYDSTKWRIDANSVTTDMPSNTWCRAPASTEGVAMIENIMEQIAFNTKINPTQVRLNNFNSDCSPLLEMIKQLQKDAEYDTRDKEVKQFNDTNRWRKRALKLLPMRFEIEYFGNFNAIVSIYHGDATVNVIHGGIEMGQGINTKTAQVCARMLGVPFDKVTVNVQTASYTSPNAMITGGSIGSECVAFATVKACEILSQRLAPFRDKDSTWEEQINKAYEAGVDMQAAYMYSAHKDDIKPYDVYAVCALELEIDILTGTHEIRRVDILEDAGRSISPKVDVGQIEGAFVMGLGYWTSEKLVYEESTGRLLTDRTWTYKPPGAKDIPADMRIYLSRDTKNKYGVLQSKATGEPAFCLATVVIHAIREAVRSARLDAGYPDQWIAIENPCTTENIFNAVGHRIEDFKLK